MREKEFFERRGREGFAESAKKRRKNTKINAKLLKI
jgi:hypothetical protein